MIPLAALLLYDVRHLPYQILPFINLILTSQLLINLNNQAHHNLQQTTVNIHQITKPTINKHKTEVIEFHIRQANQLSKDTTWDSLKYPQLFVPTTTHA